MIRTLDIIDAVAALAEERIPELAAIYTELVPKDFGRPSLLIQSVSTDQADAARELVRITEYLTLTLIDKTDDYDRSSTIRLLKLRQSALDLFRPGYLRVQDRALPVKASNGGREWGKAYVDLQLEYLDRRSEQADTTPLMERVETKITQKG